jgi:hypothetical protein
MPLDGSNNSNHISDEERNKREEFVNQIFAKFIHLGASYRF